MAEENEKRGRNRKVGVLIGLVALLFIINLVQLFFYKKSYDKNVDQELTIEEQTANIDALRFSLDSLDQELQDAIDRANALADDTVQLHAMLREVRAEKERLANRNKSLEYKANQYDNMKRQVAEWKRRLDVANTKIDSLERLSEELFAENTGLKEEKQKLKEDVDSLSTEAQTLEKKVTVGQQLKTSNVKVLALNKRGKRKYDEELKSRWIDKLKVEYEIADNPIAETGNREIYVRIIGPEGDVLKDLAAGGGSFEADGKDMFYTQKKDFMFDNSSAPEAVIWEPEDKLEDGTYKIEFYTDSYKMGEKVFVVD